MKIMPYHLLMAKRILVVDDEELIDEMLQQRLAKAGFQTASFIDPREALTFVQNQPDAIHLAIIDHNMPYLNGPQLAEKLRLILPDLPIIMITGLMEEGAPDVAYRVLKKPMTRDELLEMVEEMADP